MSLGSWLFFAALYINIYIYSSKASEDHTDYLPHWILIYDKTLSLLSQIQ